MMMAESPKRNCQPLQHSCGLSVKSFPLPPQAPSEEKPFLKSRYRQKPISLILHASSSPDLKAFPLHLRHYRSSGFAPSLPNPPRAVKGETVSVVSVFLRSSRRPSSVLRDLRPRSPSDVRRNSLLKPAPPATDSPSLTSALMCSTA